MEMKQICVECGRELSVDEFEILETIDMSPKFAMFKFVDYKLTKRSYTCKDCGTTEQGEWHRKWTNEARSSVS